MKFQLIMSNIQLNSQVTEQISALDLGQNKGLSQNYQKSNPKNDPFLLNTKKISRSK